jgi:AraC-like DNA-binding protein
MKPFEIIFSIFLSAGAIQGLVFGILLWRDQGVNRTANKVLATILFFFTYRLLVELLKIFGFGYYDWLYHILLEYNWIYGALIYFFVKAYVTPNYRFRLKDEWIHFIPVLIEFFWSNFIKSQTFFWDGTKESLSWLGYWGYVVWMHYPTQFVLTTALIIFYTAKSTVLMKEVEHERSYIIPQALRWVHRVVTVLKYYALCVLVIVLSDFLFLDYAFTKIYEYPIFVGMAAITYWLGIQGYTHRNTPVIKPNAVLDEHHLSRLKQIALQLEQKMQDDELYKDPELSLTTLSNYLGIKSYLITKCLNVHFNTKFNDYVNMYRIEELKRLLSDEKNKNYTLLALAYEAGFNSKASFNRAVKKLTGKPPGALKP